VECILVSNTDLYLGISGSRIEYLYCYTNSLLQWQSNCTTTKVSSLYFYLCEQLFTDSVVCNNVNISNWLWHPITWLGSKLLESNPQFVVLMEAWKITLVVIIIIIPACQQLRHNCRCNCLYRFLANDQSHLRFNWTVLEKQFSSYSPDRHLLLILNNGLLQ
jgi:hypothetical protein